MRELFGMSGPGLRAQSVDFDVKGQKSLQGIKGPLQDPDLLLQWPSGCPMAVQKLFLLVGIASVRS